MKESEFISKEGFTRELGLSEGVIEGWIKRDWIIWGRL